MSREAGKQPVESDVKRRITRAAVELFARKGFEATAVREIVEAADVTKPALYYHFGSKEGLGHAILSEAREKMENALREGMEGATGVLDRLVGFVEGHFRACVAERELAQFMYGVAFSPVEAALTLDVRSFREGAERMVEAILGDAAREGLMREGIMEEASRVLMGTVNICLMNHLKLGLALNHERAVQAIDFFLHGVGKGPERACKA